MRYTQVVRQHPSLELAVRGDDDRYVRASSGIETGELLCIEHAAYGTSDHLGRVLQADPELRDSLFPRGGDPGSDSQIQAKLQSNSFSLSDQGEFALGCLSSKFNHSSSPNAAVLTVRLVMGAEGAPAVSNFLYLVATRPIKRLDEIVVAYGDGHTSATGFDFIKGDTQSYDEFQAVLGRVRESSREAARAAVVEWFHSGNADELLVMHELALRGAYVDDEGQLMLTQGWVDRAAREHPGQSMQEAVKAEGDAILLSIVTG